MTDKRFQNVGCIEEFIEFTENGKYTILNEIDIENLLNKLHEENQLLKKEIERLRGRYYD